MFKTFNTILMASMVLVAAFLTSCGDDENTVTTITKTDTVTVKEDAVHYGLITEDETWSADKIHRLAGFVAVTNGATLTIEAGTRIEGNPGQAAFASALIIARDGKIDAQGTADAPIIMTSSLDDGTLADDASGLWGGLIVLGDDYISADSTTVQIEGIPATNTIGLYGGSNAGHNAGTIKYVSCRHGGSNIGEGNEINGITFGGVGAATVVENIEVVGTQDDGLEFFGGSVSVKNAVVYYNGDDAFDTDQAWAGTLENAVSIFPGDSPLELDGPEGTYTSKGHMFKKITSWGCASGKELIDFDDNTDVSIDGIYFLGYADDAKIGGYTGYAANTNGYSTKNVEFTGANVFGDMDATEVTTQTKGADLSALSWTYAASTDAWKNLN